MSFFIHVALTDYKSNAIYKNYYIHVIYERYNILLFDCLQFRALALVLLLFFNVTIIVLKALYHDLDQNL